MDDGTGVIEVRSVTKAFRSGGRPVLALNNLSFSVARGSVVAFVGPNGAGKTTTIYLLLGLLKPDQGELRVLGASPASDVLHRRRIGYQSEIFHSYTFLSAEAALRYYGRLSGLDEETLNERIPRLLKRVGLHEARHRRAGSYSKGMNQRLGIAQALLHEPELLILDEPTTGLDPEGRRLVVELIQEERARGATCFLSSHILSDVERVCDEVIMLRNGQLVLNEKLETFRSGDLGWEIEVAGLTEGLSQQLDGYALTPGSDGSVNIVVEQERKQEVLRALVEMPVDIRRLTPKRQSLEEEYLRLVGETHRNA